MDGSKTGGGRSQRRIVYSTTDGRQRFPDILQVSYGEKAVIGFDRYGRALGAVVPMEAVQILAGKRDHVDEDIQNRIRRAAQALLDSMSADGAALDIEEIEQARHAAIDQARGPSPVRSRSRQRDT